MVVQSVFAFGYALTSRSSVFGYALTIRQDSRIGQYEELPFRVRHRDVPDHMSQKLDTDKSPRHVADTIQQDS